MTLEGNQKIQTCVMIDTMTRAYSHAGKDNWEGREGGRGGMTVIHILMAPQYLNNNHVTYYVIT